MQALILSALIALAMAGLAFSTVKPLARDWQPGSNFIALLPFQNVVASGVATLNMSNLMGYTVEALLLVLGGTALTKAMLTDIQILANSKVIFDDSGSRLDLLNQYRGEGANAAYLVIPFDESRARTEFKNGAVIDGQKIGGIDTTFGIQQLTAQITIAGATAPTLSGYAKVGAAPQTDQRFRGLLGKRWNFTLSPASAGTFLFDVPQGKAKGTIIRRISLHGSTVTGYEVKRNGITIQKSSAVADTNYMATREGRVPQTNVTVIDFVVDGDESGALSPSDAATMEYYYTVSGTGNVVCVVEAYDPLNNN